MEKTEFTAEKGFGDFRIYVFLKNKTQAPKSLEINVSLFGQNQELAGWESY